MTLIFVFALATFTNTELGDSFTAELQCEVINEFSNDLCIQAGTTVYVGTENEVAIITLIWLAWVLISTMILPGITGWSPGKLLTGIRVVKADTFEKGWAWSWNRPAPACPRPRVSFACGPASRQQGRRQRRPQSGHRRRRQVLLQLRNWLRMRPEQAQNLRTRDRILGCHSCAGSPWVSNFSMITR